MDKTDGIQKKSEPTTTDSFETTYIQTPLLEMTPV